MCRWLVEAERLDVPKRLGFASLREYAEWRLGLKGRETEERVRVGKALLELPGLDEALSLGKLWWSAVRVVLPETQEAWLAWAAGKGVRAVEKQVAGRQKGDLPSDRPDPTLVKHRLSFEVRAETIAMFRELQAAIREELGGRWTTTWSCTRWSAIPTVAKTKGGRRIRWPSRAVTAASS